MAIPIVAAIGLSSLVACSGSDLPDEPEGIVPPVGAPNVLIVLTDDQRWDFMQRSLVPNIRKVFWDEGIRYPNGVVTTPLCCPSRASIFSGRYVHNHGVDDNTPGDSNWDEDLTIQKELQEAGYTTALVGKYMSNYKPRPAHFDRWAVQIRPAPENDNYFGATFNIGSAPGSGHMTEVPGHATRFLPEKAVRLLEQFQSDDDAKPWFMQISPLSPHRPYTPLPIHKDARVPAWQKPESVGEGLADKPSFIRRHARTNDESANKIRNKQLRSMKAVDLLVRDVFRWLEANDEAENTLAFFVSDNGLMLGEHGLVAQKQLPYQEAFRVPLLMRWPAGQPDGHVDRRVAANIDIAPTIFDALGLLARVDYETDGRSLLSKERRKRILIESLVSDHHAPLWRSLWTPDWQYTEYGTGEREYYDLAKDPYQTKNLLENRSTADDPSPRRLQSLKAKLHSVASCKGSACP